MSNGGLGYFEPLPAELIERILLHLPPDDVLAAKILNKALNLLISESVEIQYACTLSMHGLVDGPSSLSKHTKLVEAKRREEAWRTLDLSRRTTVHVPHHASGIYDLCGGVYLVGQSSEVGMGTDRTTELGAFELDSVKEEDGVSVKERVVDRDAWRYLGISDQIIDVGMCVREYDLIGVVGIRNRPNTTGDSTYSGDVVLHLVQFSTNEPHPLAGQPEIIVSKQLNSSRELSLTMEIVGPCLVLHLSWYPYNTARKEDMDELLLINWWTGEIILRELVLKKTYSGFAFLTANLLLLPNATERVLEVVELPELSATKFQTGSCSIETSINSDAKFRRIARIGLPRLNFSHISDMTSRADPNPFGAVHPKCASGEWRNERERDRPFSADPEKALVVLQLEVFDNARATSGRPSLIIPRDKLVEAVQRYARLKASRPVTSVRHGFGSEMGEEENKDGASGLPDSEDALRDVSDSEERVGEDMVGDGCKGSFIPWRMWAPGFTRWCVGRESRSVWITTTAGERYVGWLSTGGQLFVKDFNPYHVQQMRSALKAAARDKQTEAVEDGGDDVAEDNLPENEDNSVTEDEDTNMLRADERTTLRLVDSDFGRSGPEESLRVLFDEDIDWEELPYVEITKEVNDDLAGPRGAVIEEDRVIVLHHRRGVVNKFDVFTM